MLHRYLAGISGVLLGKQEVERVQLKHSYHLPEVRNQKATIDPLKQGISCAGNSSRKRFAKKALN
jgi:hypothetical protein